MRCRRGFSALSIRDSGAAPAILYKDASRPPLVALSRHRRQAAMRGRLQTTGEMSYIQIAF
jgi:hypothetical protein